MSAHKSKSGTVALAASLALAGCVVSGSRVGAPEAGPRRPGWQLPKSSHGEAGHNGSGPAKGDELAELLNLANSADRSDWWPAVQRLGQLANGNDALRHRIWREARVNTAGMKFAYAPPGTFVMGPDWHRVFDPQSAHSVRLSKGFFVSVTEVTNTQFQQVFPDFEPDEVYSPNPDSPPVNVTWEMAGRFCRELSQKEGAVYRLPTEAEWEYACRAGSSGKYCFGDDPSMLSEFGWHGKSLDRASPVAMLKPNAWGLYDMPGNVLEWASDWYSHGYYAWCAAQGVVEDPTGPAAGWSHVLRGGPWVGHHSYVSCTARFPRPLFDRVPFDRGPKVQQYIGFRVVRELDE